MQALSCHADGRVEVLPHYHSLGRWSARLIACCHCLACVQAMYQNGAASNSASGTE